MVNGILYYANTHDNVVRTVAHYDGPIIFKIHKEALSSDSFMTAIYWA